MYALRFEFLKFSCSTVNDSDMQSDPDTMPPLLSAHESVWIKILCGNIFWFTIVDIPESVAVNSDTVSGFDTSFFCVVNSLSNA